MNLRLGKNSYPNDIRNAVSDILKDGVSTDRFLLRLGEISGDILDDEKNLGQNGVFDESVVLLILK